MTGFAVPQEGLPSPFRSSLENEKLLSLDQHMMRITEPVRACPLFKPVGIL